MTGRPAVEACKQECEPAPGDKFSQHCFKYRKLSFTGELCYPCRMFLWRCSSQICCILKIVGFSIRLFIEKSLVKYSLCLDFDLQHGFTLVGVCCVHMSACARVPVSVSLSCSSDWPFPDLQSHVFHRGTVIVTTVASASSVVHFAFWKPLTKTYKDA